MFMLIYTFFLLEISELKRNMALNIEIQLQDNVIINLVNIISHNKKRSHLSLSFSFKSEQICAAYIIRLCLHIIFRRAFLNILSRERHRVLIFMCVNMGYFNFSL